jgi:ubiquinone biosynthesis protein COQ4
MPIRLQRAFRASVALLRLMRNPSALDEVFALADALATPTALRGLVAAFEEQPVAKEALSQRLSISLPALPLLAQLPPGSLGYELAAVMNERKLDPSSIPRRHADTPERWVVAHIYQTHDIWHIVTGFDTDVEGEVGLVAFYLAQMPNPTHRALLAGAVVRLCLLEPEKTAVRLQAIAVGWTAGRRACSLLGIDWNSLWGAPLSEIRESLRLPADGVGESLVMPPRAAA